MRRYIIALGISLFLIMVGIVLTFNEFLKFSIVDEFDGDYFSKETTTYNFKTSKVLTNIDTTFTNRATIVYDNTIAPGNIKISVIYYDDLFNIESQSIRNNDYNVIKIKAESNTDFEAVSDIFRQTIEGLKNNEIYNYAKAIRPTVKVHINKADKDIVKIRK